ncbi:hypothetical protein LCGC14_2807300 [marine sediment metagenome]|uniref:Uncharacterized protein n=1 Tax=marine sediment metagenome TaxID=412755 RepID=A0A0F8YKY7_9ZZZZ
MRDNHLTVIDAEKLKRSSFKLPQSLLVLQKNAKTFLVSQLASVFDHVDDTFFDLADRAENNRQQTVYFDAMRLIRVERKVIEHHFFNTLASNFQRLGDEKYRGHSASSRGGQGLELVENEDLEEIIALDTMVSKAIISSRSSFSTSSRPCPPREDAEWPRYFSSPSRWKLLASVLKKWCSMTFRSTRIKRIASK